MEFSIIAAFSKKNRGIGFENKLPWNIKEDMRHFKKITTMPHKYGDNCVIMGRKTWDSLPEKYKPLPNRINIIISTTFISYDINVLVVSSLEQALYKSPWTNVFIIGGERLFSEAIKHPLCKKLYLTEIYIDVDCDRFFPEIPIYFKVTKNDKFNDQITFYEYENVLDKYSEERQYLDILNNILKYGEEKPDRTGIGTYSIFGAQMRFSLMNNKIPLLTTKRVYWKGVIEELLFFLRGDHDVRKLQAKGVHIWDGNTTREYLDANNKQYLETHDIGLGYGVQWRAAGASLKKIDEDYRGKGIDQVQEVIDLLRKDPNSRRIIINAWNVQHLKDMALHPCHLMYQFNVKNGKYLNCMMTQRSADMFLGEPFNIASTAVLTRILAQIVGLSPGEIIINLGDAHIYKNHIEQVKIQLERAPIFFPTLTINKNLKTMEDIEKLEFEDFILEDYKCWPAIKGKMAI